MPNGFNRRRLFLWKKNHQLVEEAIEEKMNHKLENTCKMISSPGGYLDTGNGTSERLACTHMRRKRRTRRFVIILLFIVSEATILCSASSRNTQPIYDQQQSPIANSTGATNNSSKNSISSDDDHRIAQNVSEAQQDLREKSSSMLNEHTRGLIDHYISRKDFGKLFSLGLDQVIKIFFDNYDDDNHAVDGNDIDDKLQLFKWPHDLSAKLNCKHFDKVGESVVDFLHQHPQLTKKRTKRSLAIMADDVEVFVSPNATDPQRPSKLDRLGVMGPDDKLVGQGSQVIKSMNPRAGASMKMMMLADDDRDQDYLYEDQQQHQKGSKNRNPATNPQSQPPVTSSRNPNRAIKSVHSNNNPKPWKSSQKPTGPPVMVPEQVLVVDSEPAPMNNLTPTFAPTDQPYGPNTDGTIESPLAAVAAADASLAAAPAEPMRYHTDRRSLASLYDDQVENGTQTGDERTESHPFEPIAPEPEPMRPTSQKSARASRRRPHTATIEAPLQSLVADSANLSAQVPAPEQNPFRVKGDQRDDSATGDMNDDSMYDKQVVESSQQDNFVPQVGDQSALDHSGKRRQQQQPSDQMSELLKKQKQLRELKSLIENGFPSGLSSSSSLTANSKGSKRRQGHSSKQTDSNDYSSPMFSKEHRLPAGGSFSPSSLPFADPVAPDDLRPLDNLVRTNAPYAAIDPNIMTTGSENHVQQSSLSPSQQQQDQHNYYDQQMGQNSPMIELASENNNGQQFRGSKQGNRFSVPLQFGLAQGGGRAAAAPNNHRQRQPAMAGMVRQPMSMATLPEQQSLLNSQIQEFFNGGGSGLSSKSTKHNKRAINFGGGDGGRSTIQFSNQIYPYNNNKDPGGNGRFTPPVSGNKLFRESSMLNSRQPMIAQNFGSTTTNYQQQQQDPNNNNNFPLDVQSDQYGIPQVGPPQGQLFGLLRAAPPMVNQQRRQAPSMNNGNGNGNQHIRMPVIPASSYILPSFSTSSQSSPTLTGSTPLRFSRALNNTNYGYMPMRNSMNPAAAYQHRIGRVANSGGSSSSSSNYGDENGGSAQASVPTTSTSDPMWSDTQNQEEDYQQSPQTIQITAVPNGGFVNGFNRFNGLNGFNGLAGFNGLGYPGYPGWGAGGLDGRQVLLVNRQPQVGAGGVGGEWRSWMLPVAIILALPLILGALFVPVFLKSVMFLIQILQMLGLLMPPSQLAQHLTAGSHNQSIG